MFVKHRLHGLVDLSDTVPPLTEGPPPEGLGLDILSFVYKIRTPYHSPFLIT